MNATQNNTSSAYGRVREPAPYQVTKAISLLALALGLAIAIAFMLTDNDLFRVSADESSRNMREYAEQAWLRAQVMDLMHGPNRPLPSSS